MCPWERASLRTLLKDSCSVDLDNCLVGVLIPLAVTHRADPACELIECWFFYLW